VKGDNVLVRLVDGRAFLTDFGAGHYRGAATLTSKLLPPGTPEYRSPEAWAFVNAFLRHPTAHYPASACDDLFALGVTAYHLVTDEYPPPTQPGESGSEVWRQGGTGARPSRALNPRVSPGLDALIMPLLAVAPVERFGGRLRQAAELLEYAEQGEGPEADELLFRWSDEHRPRLRSPGRVRFVAEQDAAAREELAREELKARSRAREGREQARPWRFASVRRAVVRAGMLLAGLAAAVWLGVHEAAQLAADSEALKGGHVAVGDNSASTAPAEPATELTDEKKRAVAAPMPEQPFPGQSKAPCKRTGEVEIRGGCWYRLPDAKPPCKEKGKAEAFEWKGACYGPAYPYGGREPTSNPP
jgi:hypothetical protein